MIAEAKQLLRDRGYRVIREDVYLDPKAGYPGEEKPTPANIHRHDAGGEEIDQQDFPAASTEKGDLKESWKDVLRAKRTLREAGYVVERGEIPFGNKTKRVRELYDPSIDDDDSKRAAYEDDFEFDFSNREYDLDDYEDLDYVDSLAADAANFDENGFVKDEVF
jgi:hypothetical protein